MKKLYLAAGLLALSAVACKKTGDGEYEVEKPVVGTVTDTVHTPTVDIKTEEKTIKVPDIDVNKPK